MLLPHKLLARAIIAENFRKDHPNATESDAQTAGVVGEQILCSLGIDVIAQDLAKHGIKLKPSVIKGESTTPKINTSEITQSLSPEKRR
jgi:hypothetical protein